MSVHRQSLVVVTLLLSVSAARLDAQAPTTQPDWGARFKAEAPKEWTKLKASVGVWQGVMQTTFESPPPREKESVARTTRFYLNQRVQGQKFITTIVPDDGRMGVEGRTQLYDFHLARRRADQGLFLIGFAGADDEKQRQRMTQDRYISFLNWLLIAQSLTNSPLADYIDGPRGLLRSAEAVLVDGQTRVRLEIGPPQDAKSEFAASVLVDPGFHWAITAYDVRLTGARFLGSIEYQRDLDVAFPKRTEEKVYDGDGTLLFTQTNEFGKPEPCELPEAEFFLEAFGPEAPKTTAAPASQERPVK
jgi:hypothetical protein